MGDSHARNMEGWNTSEVWPVECLLSGMQADAHLMFGGGHLSHPPHFRLFQPPVHLASLQDGSSINVSSIGTITQHALHAAEVSHVDDSGNPTGPENNVQDNLSQPLPISNVLDESTDDEDDEDEVDDEDDDEVDMGHTHELSQQQHSHSGPLSMGHILETDTLVQCSQQVQNSLLEQQQAMMPMDSFQVQQQCLQQKQQSHVIEHEHNQTINPQITMSIPEDHFVAQNNNTSVENDPNSGLSVQGKMYLEGRVVLHLKQWADGIGGNDGHIFSSCAEQQHQKRHLQGCVVCRLASPENYRNPKEAAHRHTVKGVLFTFEDCIIVELYPEASNGNTEPKPPPPPSEPQPKDHPMPITSYMTSAIPLHSEAEQQQEEHAKKFMHHLDVSNCLGNSQVTVVQSQSSSEKHPDQTETTDWWDGFESSDQDELKRGETEEQLATNTNHPNTDSSCIVDDLKLLNSNNQQQETTGGGEEEENDDEDDDEKSKCPDTSDSFLNSNHLESHSCPTQLEDPTGSNNNNSVHNVIVNNNDHDSVTVLQINEESQQSRVTEPCSQTNKKFVSIASRIATRKRFRHPCSMCNKGFHLKRLLKQHLNEIHTDYNSFQCSSCNQEFTDKKRLNKHTCHVTTTTTTIDKSDQVSSLCFDKICAKIPPVVVELVTKSNESVDDKMSSNDEDDDDDDEDDEEDDEEILDRAVVLGSVKSEPRVLRSTGKKSKRRTITREESSSGQENHDVDFENSQDGDEDDHLMKFSDPIVSVEKKKKKSFKCEICCKGFTVERRLQNHKLSHSTERLSQCEKCGKRFARKDKLMRHMYVHSEEKLFSCDTCQKRFSRRDKLSDHLKSHGGMDEIHNCPMCDKQFLRPDILKQHVKLHTMRNKHQCTECLRFVTGKDRLDKHMARHQEAKALGQTLLCPLCTKYFIQKQSLKAHMKKFHPDSNINLDTPDSDFPAQSDVDSEITTPLKSKLLSGNSEKCNKPFECHQCPRQFARKEALKKHLRKHESEESPKSSDDFNPSTSPEEQDNNSLSLSLSSTNNTSPVHTLSITQSPAHVILTPTPPINITSSPIHSLNESPPHIPPILQHSLNTTDQCTQHSLSHHPPHHDLLTHGVGHTTQISSMAHPTGPLHANLSHMTVPAMQHHVSIATSQQSMCGPSYVLAYPHYTYQ